MARSPALVIGNAAQVRLLWSLNGNLGVNVLGASHTGSVVFNQGLADTLGAAIKAAYNSHLSAVQNGATSLVRVGIRSLSSANLQEWLDQGAPVGGAGAGDPLPANVSLCLTLRTGQSGKSFRGRAFLGGWSEANNNSSGVADTPVVTAALAFMQAVRDALTASGLTLAVLTRPQYEQIVERTTIVPGEENQVDRISHQTAKPGRFTNITSVESRSNTWETQRRRVNGRGAVPAMFDARRVIVFH